MSNSITPTPELLMPAGNFEKLRFAFAYGADAVYAGVPLYSLRARDNDFKTIESIAEAINYTHSLGKKIYLTMNIYAHNSKIEGFLKTFCETADLNPDGFILTDAGLIGKARKLRPNAIIHLSTQANATNWATVEFWKDQGVKRVILPRELSLKEITEMSRRVPDVELESFVHGAICIAYSGRCLISNYINHRDANQGTCTNSCRWNYAVNVEKGNLSDGESSQIAEEKPYTPVEGRYSLTEQTRPDEQFELDEDEHGSYMMNSKDLCAIELLKDLREAGIISFKVEGRTKSIYYLSIVTRAYRKAIDDVVLGRPFNPENLREVLSTENRTLMTGFYLRRPNEYGQNYDDGTSLPLGHRFGGEVVDFDPKNELAWVEVRNKLSVGDTVEWITPKETVTSEITFLQKQDGSYTPSTGGGMRCGIPCPIAPDQYTLLRQVLPQSAPRQVSRDLSIESNLPT